MDERNVAEAGEVRARTHTIIAGNVKTANSIAFHEDGLRFIVITRLRKLRRPAAKLLVPGIVLEPRAFVISRR